MVGDAGRSLSDSDSVCEVCGSDGRARLRTWAVGADGGDGPALGLAMGLVVEVEEEAIVGEGGVCSPRRALRRTAASGEGGSEPEGPAAAGAAAGGRKRMWTAMIRWQRLSGRSQDQGGRLWPATGDTG